MSETLCPGFGNTECSDGGVEQVYKTKGVVKNRMHCAKHIAQVRRHKALLKSMEKFYSETGVDITKSTTLQSTPPPRKLTRVAGARTATVQHQTLKSKFKLKSALKSV